MRKFRLDILDPGKPDNCTTGDIVVRSLDGQELDRFPPPVCDGRLLRALDRRTPAWVIEDADREDAGHG